ncbi:MAG TPA: hypothetical protein VHG89_00265 [Verrucomicrobiae bacterium]|nr:hypothetical protein [Verrucomicrobiae bacterium]
MKFFALFVLISLVVCPASESQTFTPSTNLVVRWEASENPWPKALWVYAMIPTKFSSEVISNLLQATGYTANDKRDYGTNGMIFVNSQKSGNLRISFTEGEIEYWTTLNYGPTNLARDVPATNQLFSLTTNFLSKTGIRLSELSKDRNGQPKIYFPEAYTEYFISNTVITNIQYRIVRFNRALDSVEFRGAGGNGEFDFSEHGRVTKIWLHWPSLKRDKLYPTIAPERIIQWIRDGKVTIGPIVDDYGNEMTIDWSKVKALTVKEASANYAGEVFLGAREHQPIFPSYVRPMATLWGTVETGTNIFKVGITCPVIDEIKPLDVK